MRPNVALVLALSLTAAGGRTPLSAQSPRTYSYDFLLDPGGEKSHRVIHGTVRVSGTRARLDTDEEKPRGEKSYFLIGNEGRTVYVVRPDRQTYEAHDADEFVHVVGTAMRAAGPVMKIDVRDVRLDTARLGAGEPVAGRPTQRMQLRQRWTMSMRVLGFVKEDMTGSSVAEYWSDPSMPLMRNPLFELVSAAYLALASADADFMAQADGARAAFFRGSPLKADIRLRMSGKDGDDATHLRYEVTKITVGGVDESALALPNGYKRTNSREVSF
jgi:hypothetical protein